jgi:hypothetical protein
MPKSKTKSHLNSIESRDGSTNGADTQRIQDLNNNNEPLSANSGVYLHFDMSNLQTRKTVFDNDANQMYELLLSHGFSNRFSEILLGF